MAQIAWTSEAQRWLRDIHNYIASDNPDAAERVALEIHDSVRVLHERSYGVSWIWCEPPVDDER